jgi:hypothetical protein
MHQLELFACCDFAVQKSAQNLATPPIEQFEAIAFKQITAIRKNDASKRQPSQEAKRIVTKILAKRARRLWIGQQRNAQSIQEA